MTTKTKIEWADLTWSPLIGCDRVSDGCLGCYAISTARIRSFNPNPKISTAFAGTVDRINGRIDWTGKINQLEDRLTQPFTWPKPQKVFVNSQSDLFHKNVDADFIDRVLAVIALTPQHTYQLLTKRPARMRNVVTDTCICGSGHTPGTHIRSRMAWAVSTANPNRIPGLPDDAEQRLNDTPWPLPNLHLGVSVEDQHWASIRIPALLDTPAAVRWISAEPLLGPIDLHPWLKRPQIPACDRCAPRGPVDYHSSHLWGNCPCDCHLAQQPGLGWVVAGGETGPKARPPHPDWFRTLRDQCAAASVPFLFKQWGDWGLEPLLDDNGSIVRGHRGMGVTIATNGTVYQPGDLTYPDGPRYREAIRAGHDRDHLVQVYRVGKKTAGRELDGVTHDAFPEPR